MSNQDDHTVNSPQDQAVYSPHPTEDDQSPTTPRDRMTENPTDPRGSGTAAVNQETYGDQAGTGQPYPDTGQPRDGRQFTGPQFAGRPEQANPEQAGQQQARQAEQSQQAGQPYPGQARQAGQQFSNGSADPPFYGSQTGYPQPPAGFVGQIPDMQHRHHRKVIAFVIAASLTCSLIGGAAGGLVVSAFTKRSTSEYSRFSGGNRMFGQSQNGSGNSSDNGSGTSSGSGSQNGTSDGTNSGSNSGTTSEQSNSQSSGQTTGQQMQSNQSV